MDIPNFPDLKNRLRQQMQQVRASLAETVRDEQSVAASQKLEREVLQPLRCRVKRALTVFLYASFRDEPNTFHLMNYCWEQQDKVLLPRVVSDDRFDVCEVSGLHDLTAGRWGIPEPRQTAKVWTEERYKEIDLVLVPGLAYDLNGGRIGYGGGYYDRFISKLRQLESAKSSEGDELQTKEHAVIAALAFQEQVIAKNIPMESHDFRVDVLATASEAIYIKGK